MGRWLASSSLAMAIRGAPRPGRRRGAACAGPPRRRPAGNRPTDAAAAVGLDRPVDAPAGHVRRDDLDHRDLGLGDLVADGVHHVGGLQRQQAGLLDHACATRRCAPASHACSAIGLPKATRRASRACTSARARARPGRSSACSGGCGPARGGPGRSRSRALRPAACWRPARARSSNTHLHVAVRGVVVAEHASAGARP